MTALAARCRDTASAEDAARDTLAAALRGRYHLLECLGTGGMSVVFAARHAVLGREVALKVLRPDLRHRIDDRERFRREARVMAGLRHPGIAAVYELDQAGGLPYFALELVLGGSLAEWLACAGRLPPDVVGRILAQLADSVGSAHASGVVHRDIKPSNVLLDGERPVLIDFGVATVATSEHSRSETVQRLGTGLYMSPEQTLGEIDAGPASDIYSLGVMAFELLAGRLPFRGSARDVALQHVARPAPRVGVFRPDVPPELEQVVARCLEKEPARRWRDARALADALRERPAPRMRRGTISSAAARLAAALRGVTARPPAVPDRMTTQGGIQCATHSAG